MAESVTAPRSLGTAGLWVAVLSLVMLPRVVRVLVPVMWVEDDAYLNCALAIAQGERPYTDFVLQHVPLVEVAIAALVRLLGPSITVVEVLNQLTVLLLNLMVIRLGISTSGRLGGLAAGIVFAFAPPLWRYHLLHRELLLAVAVVGATMLLTTRNRSRFHLIVSSLLLAVAVLVKLTAAAYVIAATVFLVLEHDRNVRRLLVFFVAPFLVCVGGTVGLLVLHFGEPFVVQAFVFALQVPEFSTASLKLVNIWREFSAYLVVGGLGALVATVARRESLRLPLLHLAIGTTFVVALKPVVWGHNGLELLPWLALFAGHLATEVGYWGARARCHRPLTAAAVSVLLLLPPAVQSGSIVGDRPRSRWIDREEVEAMARFVRAQKQGEVFVPSIVAFTANRREVLINVELDGWMHDLMQASHQQGIVALLADLKRWRSRDYFAVVDRSFDTGMQHVLAAVEQRRVAVVCVPVDLANSPVFPFVISGRYLSDNGYHQALQTHHYSLWVRASPDAPE